MRETVSRREFACGLTAGLLLSDSGASAQEKPQPATSKSAEPQPAPPPEEITPLDRIVATIVAQLPHDNLDEAAIAEIRSDVQGFLYRGKILSEFPLQNSDEPAFHFAAYRSDPVE